MGIRKCISQRSCSALHSQTQAYHQELAYYYAADKYFLTVLACHRLSARLRAMLHPALH